MRHSPSMKFSSLGTLAKTAIAIRIGTRTVGNSADCNRMSLNVSRAYRCFGCLQIGRLNNFFSR